MSRKSNDADDLEPVPGERRGRGASADDEDVPEDGTVSLYPDEPSSSVTTADVDHAHTTDAPSTDFPEEHTAAHGLPLEPTPAELTPFPEEPSQPDPSVFEAATVMPEDDSVAAAPESFESETSEHTTIDTELLQQLQASERAADRAQSADIDDRDSGSTPKRQPTAVNEVIAAIDVSEMTSVEDLPFEEKFEDDKDDKSVSVSVSVSRNDGPGSTMILDGEQNRKALVGGDTSEVARLGPAFPGGEDDPRSTEMPTSARPVVPAAYQGDGPRDGRDKRGGSGSITSDIPHDDDGWSGFQEGSDEWGGQDSVSVVKPSGKHIDTTNHPQKRKGDTGRYGPDEREHPEPVVHLVVINAEDKGPIEIPADDVALGRESDNQVVLKDPSISRKHARLTRVEDGWELIDLQSGNGTYVNGKRVDRSLVVNNDEIRLGSATFRFVDTSDGLRRVDASAAPVLAANDRIAFFARLRENPRLRTIVVGSGLLAFSLLMALILLVTIFSGNSKTHAEVFQYYLQGVEQFKQRRWVPAEGFFAAALQHDREHQRSRRYLEAITVEKRAEQSLDAAKARLNAGDLGGAYDNALQASDSLFFGGDAQKIIDIVTRDAEERMGRARAALATDDRTTAKGLLDGLEFYSAYRADLNDLRRLAGLPVVSDKTENILTAYDAPASKADDKRRDNKPIPETSRPKTPVSDALDVLADGHIDEALAKLRTIGENREAIDLIDSIGKFSLAYDEGREELRVKRPESAIHMLTQAVTLLDRIVGNRGELSKRVRNELADALYLRGVAELSSGNVEAAERTLKQATSYSDRHQASVNLLTKIQTERR